MRLHQCSADGRNNAARLWTSSITEWKEVAEGEQLYPSFIINHIRGFCLKEFPSFVTINSDKMQLERPEVGFIVQKFN